VDCHLEDPKFAIELVSAFLQMNEVKRRSSGVRDA
jgi:hypothetical protein